MDTENDDQCTLQMAKDARSGYTNTYNLKKSTPPSAVYCGN